MKSAWHDAAAAVFAVVRAGSNPAGGTRSHRASTTTATGNPIANVSIVAGTPRAWMRALASGATQALDSPKPATTRPVTSPVRALGNHFTAVGVVAA